MSPSRARGGGAPLGRGAGAGLGHSRRRRRRLPAEEEEDEEVRSGRSPPRRCPGDAGLPPALTPTGQSRVPPLSPVCRCDGTPRRPSPTRGGGDTSPWFGKPAARRGRERGLDEQLCGGTPGGGVRRGSPAAAGTVPLLAAEPLPAVSRPAAGVLRPARALHRRDVPVRSVSCPPRSPEPALGSAVLPGVVGRGLGRAGLGPGGGSAADRGRRSEEEGEGCGSFPRGKESSGTAADAPGASFPRLYVFSHHLSNHPAGVGRIQVAFVGV